MLGKEASGGEKRQLKDPAISSSTKMSLKPGDQGSEPVWSSERTCERGSASSLDIVCPEVCRTSNAKFFEI
jgi:hypothetical protein